MLIRLTGGGGYSSKITEICSFVGEVDMRTAVNTGDGAVILQ
jgi:hypothetical protein